MNIIKSIGRFLVQSVIVLLRMLTIGLIVVALVAYKIDYFTNPAIGIDNLLLITRSFVFFPFMITSFDYSNESLLYYILL